MRKGVLEGQPGGVGAHDLDVRVRKPLGELGRKPLVQLDRRQLRHHMPNRIGGKTRTGPNLQHGVAQREIPDRVGKDFLLDDCLPFGAGAKPKVGFVHWRTNLPRRPATLVV